MYCYFFMLINLQNKDVVRNLKVFDPFLISHLIALSAAQLIRSESISFSGQQSILICPSKILVV